MNDEILKIIHTINSLNFGIDNFWKFGIVKACIIDVRIILKNDTKVYRFIYSSYKF